MSAAATAVRTMMLVLVLVLVTSRDKVAPTVVLVAEISRESDQLMVRGERVRLVPGIRAAAHDCCYTTEERYRYLYVPTNAIANISVLIYLIIYLSPYDRETPVILTGVPETSTLGRTQFNNNNVKPLSPSPFPANPPPITPHTSTFFCGETTCG